ncbi:hypothetical protein LSM04_002653 [Trypanosoma melophagium]|uniref:uncharacterized protein n=1 Tax=Trypanosoma melophagium TaxID=715481 RepID=UPI00351A17BB|nr:hypothetical protein LSM04_002653 [Trypanosoma melophagium]
MSAWASGSLVERLKQQKLSAANNKDGVSPPAAPTLPATSSTASNKNSNNNNNNNNNNNAPYHAPLVPPSAVDDNAAVTQKLKPVVSPARGQQRKEKQQEEEQKQLLQEKEKEGDGEKFVQIGALSLPQEIAELASLEFTFVGHVKTPPLPVEECSRPAAPAAHGATSPMTTFVPPNVHQRVAQMSDTSRAYPMHHHHHHHRPHQYQQQQQQQHYYHYQPQPQPQPQPQQCYMQHGMTGQSYQDAYGSMPYNMSPYAAPYHPRMYNGYPGMGMYAGMGEYCGFSLQGRPAYYPPPQSQMGPYIPPQQ